jgi:hypothetical protein
MGRKICHSFVNDGTRLLRQALEFTRYCRSRAAHREYNKLTILVHLSVRRRFKHKVLRSIKATSF